MKKLLNQIILSLALVLFTFSYVVNSSIHSFNVEDTYENIKFLSSNYFKGRLTGTLENKEIEEYIKLKFIENDLKPFMGEYTDSFTTEYPKRIDDEPYLFISDGEGNRIEEFTYGKDYKEDMINFKTNKFTFSENSEVFMRENMIQANTGEDYFLLYSSNEQGLDFRSSFMSDCPWSMAIIISDVVLNSIKDYINNGYYINCFIPFENSETTARNIMGVIPGESNEDPIIITAHFDHLGIDLAKNIYSGALDNASGTAFIMELMKYLNSLGTPDRDILFVAFNAEEFGCLGSEAFVTQYEDKILDSKVFNFDMIGSNNAVPLSIMGGINDNESTPFMRSASGTCADEDVQYNYLFQNSSDHKSFREKNIDAVTFCDNDLSLIHTPNDTVENISLDNINRCYKVASTEIIKYAYNGNPLLLYYKEIMSICIFVIIVMFLKNLLKNK